MGHFSESILKKLKDGTLEDKLIINLDEFGGDCQLSHRN